MSNGLHRINITLPAETLRHLDRAAPKGKRSRLINQALKNYIKEISREALKKQLKEGSQTRAKRDLELAEQWFLLEEETWPKQKK